MTIRQVGLAVLRSFPVSVILSMLYTNRNVNTLIRASGRSLGTFKQSNPFQISRKIEYKIGFMLFTGCASACRRKVLQSAKPVSMSPPPSSIWNPSRTNIKISPSQRKTQNYNTIYMCQIRVKLAQAVLYFLSCPFRISFATPNI